MKEENFAAVTTDGGQDVRSGAGGRWPRVWCIRHLLNRATIDATGCGQNSTKNELCKKLVDGCKKVAQLLNQSARAKVNLPQDLTNCFIVETEGELQTFFRGPGHLLQVCTLEKTAGPVKTSATKEPGDLVGARTSPLQVVCTLFRCMHSCSCAEHPLLGALSLLFLYFVSHLCSSEFRSPRCWVGTHDKRPRLEIKNAANSMTAKKQKNVCYHEV